MQRRVEGFERLQRGLDVRGLGIVDVAHAAQLAHLLEAVRRSGELAQGRVHARLVGAERAGDRDRAGRVGAVVRPAQARGGEGFLERPEIRAGDADPTAIPGEVVVAEARDVGVVDAEDCDVVCALALEHAQLGGRVGAERAVAVEMVGRHVQEHGGMGAELLDALELKARELAHDRAPGLDRSGEGGQRGADVAGGVSGDPAALEHRRRQERGRCLAVGSGDADDRIALLEQAVRELHLGPHGDAGRSCGADDLGLLRDAWALDEQVGAHEELGIVAAGHRFDARRGLPCIGPAIGEHDVHVRCAASQRLGGGDARAHRAEHDGAAGAGDHGIHQRYWSKRRYASTNAEPASSAATIQKRTMIVVSDHAFISKWWWIGAIRKMRRP